MKLFRNFHTIFKKNNIYIKFFMFSLFFLMNKFIRAIFQYCLLIYRISYLIIYHNYEKIYDETYLSLKCYTILFLLNIIT